MASTWCFSYNGILCWCSPLDKSYSSRKNQCYMDSDDTRTIIFSENPSEHSFLTDLSLSITWGKEGGGGRGEVVVALSPAESNRWSTANWLKMRGGGRIIRILQSLVGETRYILMWHNPNPLRIVFLVKDTIDLGPTQNLKQSGRQRHGRLRLKVEFLPLIRISKMAAYCATPQLQHNV